MSKQLSVSVIASVLAMALFAVSSGPAGDRSGDRSSPGMALSPVVMFD
ncbi:hypothetical protein PF049_12545 [Erythrobacteraceae bacterium WH01K]|nr:hypothetical protein PF049_12545 [Erythrobacteraceae bacterium WH01K]